MAENLERSGLEIQQTSCSIPAQHLKMLHDVSGMCSKNSSAFAKQDPSHGHMTCLDTECAGLEDSMEARPSAPTLMRRRSWPSLHANGPSVLGQGRKCEDISTAI